jgi:tRNA(Glu) U13 pseudouridine synthase TruD
MTADRFGSLNSAYFFNGNNGVKITVQDAISLRPQSLTLNLWVFISNSTMWNNILSKRIASNNINSFAIYETSSNVNAQVNSEPFNLTITINGIQYQTKNLNPICTNLRAKTL